MNKEYPSYDGSLAAAGATVHAFQMFGSYQGDWLAKVTLPDGRTGWIKDGYGSCSGCDGLEATFSYSERESADYAEKYAAFGRNYFDALLTQEEAEKAVSENIEWDMDAPPMLAFVQANK